MIISFQTLVTWLRSTKAGQVVLFALGVLFTYWGYIFWQIVAAFACFFTFGSGAGHDEEGLVVSIGFLALHVGVVSWLFWRRVLYITWWAWALSVAIPVGVFTHYMLLP